MKLSDYIAWFLKKQGIRHVFGLTGGAVVHLFDSVAKTPGIKPIFNHHEQASALAAQAYARVSKRLGAAFVTTGPGGTNALTGVCAAWLDSIPSLYISGQARIEHSSRGKAVRQVGTQELDIVSLVSPVTKYAVMLEDPSKIKYCLEKAVYLATTGRPGPVWVDIPLNFQWASIDPDKLEGFKPPCDENHLLLNTHWVNSLERCLNLMAAAKRPLVLAGHGIRLAHAEKEFKEFIEKIKWPFVSSWNASDILPTRHALYTGRPGIAGQRGANLAVQTCDLLLALGSHLSIPLTGTAVGVFARSAKKIVVDIDSAELESRDLPIDLAISSDVKVFLGALVKKLGRFSLSSVNVWRKKCAQFQSRYNTIPTEWHRQKNRVNPYVFVDTLSQELRAGDVVVVDGGGTVVYTAFQALKTKPGQRLIISAGICAMGTGLPESIGACLANSKKRTICLCGDGSAQLNIQELQTIVHHKLPIKIFIFNNDGYLSIRHTQRDFLGGRYTGSEKHGGVSLPNILKVAKAYGLRTERVSHSKELVRKIRRVLAQPGPVLCDIIMPRDGEVVPRIGFDKKPDGTYMARPFEDMAPYLNRKEFAEATRIN
ncbi:MAG: thiamine pyrophosphate-binding protein [Candidatus Omnitrophica bacterium]|nr:thiamine pyrophosphate-binding protein [Candidatus Omnitrophota bacterium]